MVTVYNMFQWDMVPVYNMCQWDMVSVYIMFQWDMVAVYNICHWYCFGLKPWWTFVRPVSTMTVWNVVQIFVILAPHWSEWNLTLLFNAMCQWDMVIVYNTCMWDMVPLFNTHQWDMFYLPKNYYWTHFCIFLWVLLSWLEHTWHSWHIPKMSYSLLSISI